MSKEILSRCLALKEKRDSLRFAELIHPIKDQIQNKNWDNAIQLLDELNEVYKLSDEQRTVVQRLISNCNREIGYNFWFRLANAAYHNQEYFGAKYFYENAYSIFRSTEIEERINLIDSLETTRNLYSREEPIILVDSLPGNIVVLTLKPPLGNLNAIISPRMKSEMVHIFNGCSKTSVAILDLKYVEYVDSSGMSTLMTANRLFTQYGGLVFCSYIKSESVKKLFEISRLDTAVNLANTKAEAIKFILGLD